MNSSQSKKSELKQITRSKLSLPITASDAHKIPSISFSKILQKKAEKDTKKSEINFTHSSFETDLNTVRTRENDISKNDVKSKQSFVIQDIASKASLQEESLKFYKPQSTRISREMSSLFKGAVTSGNTPIISPDSSYIKSAREMNPQRISISLENNFEEAELENISYFKNRVKILEKEKLDLNRQIRELEKIKAADRKRYLHELEKSSKLAPSETERIRYDHLEKENNTLVSELSKMDITIKDLKKENDFLTNELTRIYNECSNIDSGELAQLKEQVKLLETDKDHYIMMYSEGQDKIDSKNQEIEVLNTNIENLKEKIAMLDSNLVEKSLELEKKDLEISDLCVKIKDQEFSISSFEANEANLKKQIHNFNDKEDSLINRMRELECMLATLITSEERVKREKKELEYICKAQMEDYKKKKDFELQTILKEKSNEFSKVLESENEALRKEVSSLKMANNGMQNSIANEEFQIKHLETELTHQKDVRKGYEEEVAHLKVQIDSQKDLQIENENLRTTIGEMEILLEACQNEIRKFKENSSQNQMNDANIELEILECKAKEYEDAFNSQQKEFEKLSYKNLSLTRERDSCLKELEKRENEIFDLKSDLNFSQSILSQLPDIQEKIKTLEQKIAEKDKELSQSSLQILSLTKEVEKFTLQTKQISPIKNHRKILSVDNSHSNNKKANSAANQENLLSEKRSVLYEFYGISSILKDSNK